MFVLRMRDARALLPLAILLATLLAIGPAGALAQQEDPSGGPMPEPGGAPAGGDPFGGVGGGGVDPFGGDPFGGGAADPFGGGDPFAAPRPASPPPRLALRKPKKRFPASDMVVDAALAQRVTLGFIETPLKDVLDHISNVTKTNIDADVRALNDVGIGTDTPITFRVEKMRLESALRHMLRELDLVHLPRDGRLIITTAEEAEDELTTQVYPVKRLLWPSDPLIDDEEPDTDSLIDVITCTIRPTTWEEVGGPGSTEPFGATLAISQSHRVHQEIRQLLAALEKAIHLAETAGDKPPKAIRVPQLQGDEAKIEKALEKPIELEFIETPLEDVMQFVARKMDINVRIEARALDDVGLGSDTPITRSIKDVSLESALRSVMRELDLTFVIRDDALVITTPEEAESELLTRIYPVADLVFVVGDDDDDFLAGNHSPWAEADYDSLIDLITTTVRPTAWDSVGGPGNIDAYRGCLVFSQTEEVFQEIDTLLAGLRKLAAQHRQFPRRVLKKPTSIDEVLHPRVAGHRARLVEEVGMIGFQKTSLEDVADLIAEKTGVPIQIDRRALEDVGVDSKTRLSATLGGETLAQALRRVLRPLDLSWTLRDEVVLITTPEEAESALITKLYPVRDLVLDEDYDPRDPLALDFTLIDVIESTVDAETWDRVGGAGSVESMSHPVVVLVISQTEQTHEKVAGLLAQLRSARAVQKDAEAGETGDAQRPEKGDKKVLTNKQGQRLYLKVYQLAETQKLEHTGESSKELAAVIEELVEPASWKSDDKYYLRAVTGSIIVRHTKQTHRKIHRLLSELDALHRPGIGGLGSGGVSAFGSAGGACNGGNDSGGGGLGGGKSGASGLSGGVF